ncbi:hypothetical protein [Ruminococcus sp. NK3A76]|uniref:hypothetical protein n=1 Tax=Ruminococcus sp. NK3A76 TaxID=877411 RepID=UPI00048C2CCE|nr:hypothetical protein [Ruminococcus sp. NK3A76]
MSKSSFIQERYWSSLTDKKFALYYIDAHFAKSIQINRTIKIIMAIASCSSIAAWAIWKQLAFVWGVIIAISQVVGVINEYLPYQKRIEDISSLKSEWSVIFLSMEKEWLNVSNGNMTEGEINDLLFQFEKEWNEADDKYFQEDSLPQNKKCYDYAEDKMMLYFERQYGGK